MIGVPPTLSVFLYTSPFQLFSAVELKLCFLLENIKSWNINYLPGYGCSLGGHATMYGCSRLFIGERSKDKIEANTGEEKNQ